MFRDCEELYNFLTHHGEVMVVLDSDREYELHTHDTEIVDVSDKVEDGVKRTVIKTVGMKDGEYSVVYFSADAVEHVYVHEEN